MKQIKTLAQVANDIEKGNNLHEYYNNDGATIKAGNFESFGDFLSYYRQHYRPLLEAIRNGDTLDEKQRHTLNFMADDLIKMFWDEEDSDASEDEDEDPTLTEKEKRDTLCRLWDAAWHQAKADPKTYRVIVETNEADPSAPANEFGRYYMIDKADGCGNMYDRWQVIRADIVKSPYPVHRPNYAAANGYADDQAQICIEVENRNNIVRWILRMIDAGRVTDIYADCY